jgi:Na+/proline symporter
MLENAPSSLNLTNQAALLFMFGGAFFGIGEVFMDNTFWQRAYAIRQEDVLKTFMLSGIGWALVPLAVASLAFVALAFGREPEQINQVAPLVAQVYGGQFAGWLFLVAVWSALASTTAASINALATLLMHDLLPRVKEGVTDDESLQYGKYLTVVVGVLGLLLSLPRILTMLQMLIFLGVINAAFIFPIVLGLWSEKTNPTGAFVAALVAIVGGYAVYFTVGNLQGIIASGWLSFLITAGSTVVWPSEFDWRKLQRAGRSAPEGGE